MAVPSPRAIFACAIPTIIVILSYIWFKRKKDLEAGTHQEHLDQKSQQYHVEEVVAYQRAPESDFQKLPPDESQTPVKMVIETTSDKEFPRLGKSEEECEECESTTSGSSASSSGLYHGVRKKTPPPLTPVPLKNGESGGFKTPIIKLCEHREVVNDIISCITDLALQSPGTHDCKQSQQTEMVNDIEKQLMLHKTDPKDDVLMDGRSTLCVNMSQDSTFLECQQDIMLAPQVCSQDVEFNQEGHQDLMPTLVEDTQGIQDTQSFQDTQSSLNTTDYSVEDYQSSLDVEVSPNAEHIFLDDSHCSLDVVGIQDNSQTSLDYSQCSLDVEGISDVSDAEKSQVMKSSSDEESATSKDFPNTESSPLEGSHDIKPTLDSSIVSVHNYPPGSPELQLTSFEGSPERTPVVISTLQDKDELSSWHSVAAVPTPLPSSFHPTSDVKLTSSESSADVEPTLEIEGLCEEVDLSSCHSSTPSTTLTEIEISSTEAVLNQSIVEDGNPVSICEPASEPDHSIVATDQVETELNEVHPVTSPGLPTDDAELQKLVNCNSISAYGSSSHSPADELLESPTTSNYSDLHSEGSSDSGKGGSDIHTPNVEGNVSSYQYTALQVYEFEIPQGLCGRLIGVRGRYVNLIKSKSRANISIKRHPFNPELKLCAVIGAEDDINSALALIRKRFPTSKFPGVNMIQVNSPLLSGMPIPETQQLQLPDGITSDVILSSLVDAGHFFIQQPTHPTYSLLSRLDHCMLQCYQEGLIAPKLPMPVEAGIICAATTMGGWYRAQVVYVYPDSDECEVKFVDYGGYSRESVLSLRQIRSDFMTLPFQATECFLGNVVPIDESLGWSLEATTSFEEMAQGQILQAQTMSYSEDGIPYVHLYRVQGITNTFINRQLVTAGHANWVNNQE